MARRRDCAPLQRQGPARDQDALRDRASVAQAHFRPIGRTGMRALGLRPILPVLHRRGVSPVPPGSPQSQMTTLSSVTLAFRLFVVNVPNASAMPFEES